MAHPRAKLTVQGRRLLVERHHRVPHLKTGRIQSVENADIVTPGQHPLLQFRRSIEMGPIQERSAVEGGRGGKFPGGQRLAKAATSAGEHRVLKVCRHGHPVKCWFAA